ncbi:MAG: hypothetical protein BGO78_00270 [Chloroflexi bacterium 44-23]|nr:MAG: hypothetical protein BGO78_00270 [Chloroflexi bacterium 44-23]
MKENLETSTVLAIKIDRMVTKIFFFDIVDEKYHLIASSEARTTSEPPFNDVREGVSHAIDRIQQITGRHFYDDEGSLITPMQSDGSGVDHLVITFGFFSKISIVSVGLLESISLESLNKLLATTQLAHLDQIGMNDSRKLEEIIALFTNKLPDMVVIAGGVNEGAARSIMRQVDMLLFCIKLVPRDKRPYLIFSGNSDFEPQIRESVGDITNFQLTQNLRPSINHENLMPAYNMISQVQAEILGHKIGGFSQLSMHCVLSPLPFSHTTQIMTRFLSLLSKNKEKNVLYIDFGKEVISLSAGNEGNSTFLAEDYSLNYKLNTLLPNLNIGEVIKKSHLPVTEEEVKNFLWDLSIHPNTIPTTENHLAIEKAVTEILIQNLYRKMLTKWPDFPLTIQQVIVSGEIFQNHFGYGESLQTILDSFMPDGIVTLYLDQHGILPVLGAIAAINRYLPIHIMDSSVIALLAKVIPIKSNAKPGSEIAVVITEFEDGNRIETKIEQGMIYRLHVPAGQMVNLYIEPKTKIDIDPATKNFNKGFPLQGGLCGVVIDARGRPLMLPKDFQKRKEIQKIWGLQLSD